jgi:hypothetical protein
VKLIYSAVLTFVFASFSMAGDLPTSFKEAASSADAQNDDAHAVRDYLSDSLRPYYQKKYGPLFVSCLKSGNYSDVKRFEFIAVIGADGKVVRLFIDRESDLFSCVRETLEKDEFPRPPIAPFYWRVQMTFDPEQSKLQISSTPDAADIELDGKYVGGTPSSMIVPAGQHRISVNKSGFKPWERQITVSTGQVNVNATLEKKQQ